MAGKTAGRLGVSFRPPEPDRPLGAAFRQGKKAEMPSIVVVHPLALLRDVAVRRGWPRTEPDINAAMEAAQEAGELDLSPIEVRYGAGAWEKTPKLIFPPLNGSEDSPDVFRAVEEGGRVVLYPPEVVR